MYQKILIPLENGPSDASILEHIRPLARMTGARLTVMHVANGWAARNFERLDLAESEEIVEDRAYLERIASGLREEGFVVESHLAMGEPYEEIVRFSKSCGADLIAMATHGHRLVGDILYGSTADKVRHRVDAPVLLLKSRG